MVRKVRRAKNYPGTGSKPPLSIGVFSELTRLGIPRFPGLSGFERLVVSNFVVVLVFAYWLGLPGHFARGEFCFGVILHRIFLLLVFPLFALWCHPRDDHRNKEAFDLVLKGPLQSFNYP